MEDKQMLELAAKAAGIRLEWVFDQPKEVVIHWSGNPEDGGETRDWDWNPLDNDGDALRLAVECGINIFVYPDEIAAAPSQTGTVEKIGACKFKTCRRAIVRAAAEIGRYMP